jgi:hypothetical protein
MITPIGVSDNTSGGAMMGDYKHSKHRLTRKGSPQTSFDAVPQQITNLETRVLAVIESYGRDGCIADEVLTHFQTSPYSSVTARFKALVDTDQIVISGTRHGLSGKPQRIMKAKKFDTTDEAKRRNTQETYDLFISDTHSYMQKRYPYV